MKTILQMALFLGLWSPVVAQKTTTELPKSIAALDAVNQKLYSDLAARLPKVIYGFLPPKGTFSVDQILAKSQQLWKEQTGETADAKYLVYAKSYFENVVKTGNRNIDFRTLPNLSAELKTLFSSVISNIPELPDATSYDTYLLGYSSKINSYKLTSADRSIFGALIAMLYANYQAIVDFQTAIQNNTGGRFCWSCIVKGIKCGLAMVGGAGAGALVGGAAGTVTLPVVGTVSGAVFGMVTGAATGLATCI